MIYKLFYIIKHNTDIQGYWKQDNKIYIDNVIIKKYTNKKLFNMAKQDLFNTGELAVFYIINNKGIIENKQGNITILNKRIEYKHKKSYKNIQIIKDIIAKYNGCTVYNKKGYIIIEVYTNK